LTRPWSLGGGLHLQSIMIIQPIDILESGAMNMCDACPDITVHEDELVWSCRLEERMKFGGFARGVPRKAAVARAAAAGESAWPPDTTGPAMRPGAPPTRKPSEPA
jgi:hypothetical protein